MSASPTPAEIRQMHRKALLGGAARAMDLVRRVPDLLEKRGWPHRDQDLNAVLIAAVACKRVGAGRQAFRRPKAADGLGGKWPATSPKATASQIVDTLELDDLLVF